MYAWFQVEIVSVSQKKKRTEINFCVPGLIRPGDIEVGKCFGTETDAPPKPCSNCILGAN